MKTFRFILAIDLFLVRKGMSHLLNQLPGVRVIREIDTFQSLDQYLRNHGTDFLIISQSLFHQSTALFLSHTSLAEKTILLRTDCAEEEQEDLHASICFSEGKEEILNKITHLLDLHTTEALSESSRLLTRREETIVRLVSMGLTNRQIADKLFLSTHTVTTHRKNITGKLGIKSVSGLTVYAIVNNIITIDEVSSKPSE